MPQNRLGAGLCRIAEAVYGGEWVLMPDRWGVHTLLPLDPNQRESELDRIDGQRQRTIARDDERLRRLREGVPNRRKPWRRCVG